MINTLGNTTADLDQAHRADLELLHLQRAATAKAHAARISDLDAAHQARTADHLDLIAAIKTDAAAQDLDFAKAIARRVAMLGEPAVEPYKPPPYRQAAE